jgi:glycosyltransferase involved in cell wall biosynthesis
VLRAAERAGVSSNVEAVGFLSDRTALPEYYRRAHLFASPALHEVGVANVYVEAMASGCPVLASSTGGAPEAVLDGETGLLVPPEDVDAAAAAIDRILGDPTLRARMSVAARARAVDHFATDRYADRVLAAYDETIARSAQRRGRAGQRQRGSR